VAETTQTTSQPSEPVEPVGRVERRLGSRPPIIDPGPLGLAALAVTLFAFSIANANVWGSGADAALALALVYGGAIQILAAVWEFVRKNTFGSLMFGTFGAFWVSYYVLAKFVIPEVRTPSVPEALGVFLLGFAVVAFYMIVASLRVSAAMVVLFVLLTATLTVLTIAQFEASNTLIKAGGWIGVVTAAVAFYASFAGVVNETFGSEVIPVLPLSLGRDD
jgi:uncharacterized protein